MKDSQIEYKWDSILGRLSLAIRYDSGDNAERCEEVVTSRRTPLWESHEKASILGYWALCVWVFFFLASAASLAVDWTRVGERAASLFPSPDPHPVHFTCRFFFFFRLFLPLQRLVPG